MTGDLLLTVGVTVLLVASGGLAIAMLPWTDAELDKTERGFRALGRRLMRALTGRQ